MAISLKHEFQSVKVDGPDTTLVQPSNWNDEHVLTQGTGALLGRSSAGTGPTEEITVSGGLVLAGGVLSAPAVDPLIAALASLTTAANQMFYTTGVDTVSMASLTAAGRAILDDLTSDAQLTTLGATALGKALFAAVNAAAARTALEISALSEAQIINPASTVQGLATGERVAQAVSTQMNKSGSAPMFACRAWVNFNGTTGVIRASGNVSSVTDNGVGNYTVNFTTPMIDANYAIAGFANFSSANAAGLVSGPNTYEPAAGSVNFRTANSASGGATDYTYVNLAVFR